MKIMVLGGGGCQVNLIRRLKESGDEVILADYLPHCPGAALADIHVPVSTFDIPAVTEAARRHQAAAIVTTGTDQPVLTAAAAAEALSLPFYIGSATARAVTNKRIMKEIFQENGIPTLLYRLLPADFDENTLKDFPFPAVLKPVDSQGQRGVFRLNSPEEVRDRIRTTLSFSREDQALLETYYENDEITVNGWVTGGRAVILSVVDRVTMTRGAHIGICLCHHFPSVHLAAYHDDIAKVTDAIVAVLGIGEGPIYFQYLIGADGLVVNEIAMRLGGAYEDITLPIITGLDPLAMLIDTVKTGSCDTAGLVRYRMDDNPIHLSTQLFFCRPGRIASITPADEIAKMPGVHRAVYAIREGDVIPPIEDATARAGYFIVEGMSRADMLRRVNDVFDHMQVLDEEGQNLVITYRDYPGKYRFYEE